MTPQVEKIINDYINSPTGKIKQIYPVIDKIDLEYHINPEVDRTLDFTGMNRIDSPTGRDSREWLEVNVYLNTPIDEEEDLWDTHNFDWAWMMDHHIMGDIIKLFGINKLPYKLYIYAPRDEDDYNNMLRHPDNTTENSYWKYITGSGGLNY